MRGHGLENPGDPRHEVVRRRRGPHVVGGVAVSARVVAHHARVPGVEIGGGIRHRDQCPLPRRAGFQQRERRGRFGFGVGEHRRGHHDARRVQAGAGDGARGDDLQFHSTVHVGADRSGPWVDLVGQLDRIDVETAAADGRPRIELEMKSGDHCEEAGAGTARRPVQVGVVVPVDVQALPVGGDHIETQHAFAGRPEHAAVPAVSALQEVAADADALAMARGEEQVLRRQPSGQHTAAHARADHSGSGGRVDRAAVEAADVEEHPAVTDVVAGPAVPA